VLVWDARCAEDGDTYVYLREMRAPGLQLLLGVVPADRPPALIYLDPTNTRQLHAMLSELLERMP